MPGQIARTLADLRLIARYYIDELSAGVVLDSSIVQLDLNTALMLGYEEYARRTKCFSIEYTLASTASQATYAHEDFGVTDAGNRIFELYYVGYNALPLERTTRQQLSTAIPAWRSTAAGTPLAWFPSSDMQLTLYPKPSGTSNILVEGWETPDPAEFAADADEPLIHVSDRYLIAVYAALVTAKRLPNVENAARYQELNKDYDEGMMRAAERINNDADKVMLVQRNVTNIGPGSRPAG